MTSRLAVCFAAVTLAPIAFFGANLEAQAKQQVSLAAGPTAAVPRQLPMPMTAPLFLESQTYTSTLYLVNQLSFGVEADVTAFDMSGALLTTGHFYLDANTSQTISVRKLLSDAGLYAEVGSIEVVSPENWTALLGQLSITRTGDSKAFLDEELFMPEKTTSSSLRAVIDSPQNSPIVSVTNVSPTDALTIHLTCTPSSGSIVSKTVNLLSKQTKLVRACSTLGDVTLSPSGVDAQFVTKAESSMGMAGDQVAGISIAADGPIGDVAAFGFVEHADSYGRYFSAMNFADTGLLNSTGTVFAGVPVGTSDATPGVAYTPQVALTNFTDTPQTAHVFLATSVAGISELKEIANLTIAPKSSQLVTLPQSKGSPRWENSFIVRSSGKPGDMLSKMMFKTTGPLPNVELIGKDELDLHNAGDHPWSLENGIGSTLYLFNHSEATRKVTVRLGSAANVWLKIYDLQPNETKSFAIGDLIQRQVPDDKGFVFPQSVTHGEVAWWAPADGAPKVSGRVVQTDAQGTMARNFSCGSGIALSGIVWPGYSGNFSVQDGNMLPITPQPQFSVVSYGQYGTCPSGQLTNQTYNLSWSWSVGQLQIAHIVNGTQSSQTVNLQGWNQGNTLIQVNAYAGGNNGCSTTASLQVTAPNSITSVSPMVYGGTGTVTIQGVGFYGTPTVTSQGGNITFTNAVTNNTTTITANYSSGCGSTTDSVMVSFANETQPYAPYPVQLTLPNAPAPTITMGGTTVSGTTTSVVIGQQIALTGNPGTLPNCFSVQSQQWGTPTGNPIGAYSPTNSSGAVTPFTASTSGTQSFYWYQPSAQGSPWSESFSYQMSGGGSTIPSPAATSNFNVQGPSSLQVYTCGGLVYASGCTTNSALGNVAINQSSSGPVLQFGGPPPNVGIAFTATATAPSGSTNNFEWIQLVNSDTVVYTATGGSPVSTCTDQTSPVQGVFPALDTTLPYAQGNVTNDNPKVGLASTNQEVTRSFSATMFTLWSPGLANSIYVPLGSVDWQFSGDAIITDQQSNSWNLKSGTRSSGTFQPSSAFPSWSGYTVPNVVVCHS